MKNLGLESKTENLNCDEVATILESDIDDILFEDTTEDDLYTFSLFETDDVMNYKVNAMKSNFSYLFNVFLMVVCIVLIKIHAYLTFILYALNHLISAQKMNHILHISKDITLDERREIKKYW